MTITSSQFWKRTVSLTVAVALVGFFGFSLAEPATSTAQNTASTSFTASLTVDQQINITAGGNISMNPNINLSSDTSTGNTTLTVETNADEGYTLAVKAGSDPALQGDSGQDDFADYSPSTTNTPDAWSVDSSSKEFGYAAYGDDVSSFNNGSSCSDNNPANHDVYYEGFATTDENIASNSGSTANGGNTTTLCVAAEQNGVEAEAGGYTANLTATATTN
jgi:hypothetical protein